MMHCFTILFPRLSEKKYFALCVFNNDSNFLDALFFLKNEGSIEKAPLPEV